MATRRVIADFPPKRHDHRTCVRDALQTAESVCAKRDLRLTDLRRRILELVWSRHGPVRAYDILRLLNETNADANATPNTVYRALDFLLAAGLIHRLESINAFMGCASPTSNHAGQFLICRNCESAAEIHDSSIQRHLAKDAAALGFSAETQMVELMGLCPSCSTS